MVFLCPKRAQPTRRNHDRRGQRQPAGGIDRERSEAARNRLRGQIQGGRPHSREWEKRAKDNKAAADELQQLKEAQLSEAEKTAKHIKELEAKNAAYEAEKQQNEWKTQVSKETGVPIALLHGSTLEEMQANGKALADYIAEKTKPKVLASSESNQPPAPSGSSGDWIRDQFLEQKQK